MHLGGIVDIYLNSDFFNGGIVDIYLNSDFFKENEQEVHQYFKEFGWESKVIDSTISDNKVAHYTLSIKPI